MQRRQAVQCARRPKQCAATLQHIRRLTRPDRHQERPATEQMHPADPALPVPRGLALHARRQSPPPGSTISETSRTATKDNRLSLTAATRADCHARRAIVVRLHLSRPPDGTRLRPPAVDPPHSAPPPPTIPSALPGLALFRPMRLHNARPRYTTGADRPTETPAATPPGETTFRPRPNHPPFVAVSRAPPRPRSPRLAPAHAFASALRRCRNDASLRSPLEFALSCPLATTIGTLCQGCAI